MTFQEQKRSHLSRYKREVLGVEDDGIWAGNGKPYSHILPASQQKLNILPLPCEVLELLQNVLHQAAL